MMDKKTCPKHAEFYCKNKFEKLVHLVGFIISKQIRLKLFFRVDLTYNWFTTRIITV